MAKINWLIVELLKYIIGGIIGALIALSATQTGKLLAQTTDSTEKKPRVMVTAPTKKQVHSKN